MCSYVLRVAYVTLPSLSLIETQPGIRLLSYKIQPKAVETLGQPEAEGRDLKAYGARVSDAIYSIGDLFRDSGAKGVRFPKDLLKALEQKLQDIAMGRDPRYVPSYHRTY